MNKIVVIDFGGQYSHLIANRIRRLNVYSEIYPSNTKLEDIKKDNEIKGIILSGGPSSVYEPNTPTISKEILNLGIPILGLCYGHQMIAHLLDGVVEPGKIKEYGLANLKVLKKEGLFYDLSDEEIVWMSHGDSIKKLPYNFEVIGSTSDCQNAAIVNSDKQIYGLQFHPEVTHTKNGMKILENFVFRICNMETNWDMHNYISNVSNEIKNKVGNKNVLVFVSGGVDSLVSFILLNKILGKEKVIGVYINNGFMRKNESNYIQELIKHHKFSNLRIINEEDTFLNNLRDVFDPEKKRKIIGKTFVDVKYKVMDELNLDKEEWILGQGTIYPDVIESKGTENADLIKTHHNRVPEIKELIEQGMVIEPLSYLYKDEVRKLGLELGLSNDMVYRHPFPGPGLAIRVLCSDKEIKEDFTLIEKKIEKLIDGTYIAKVIPIKSVGVQGDSRTYRHPVILQGNLKWDNLEEISTIITNNMQEINRVLFLISPDKISEVYVEEGYLSKERLDLLREIDHEVTDYLKKNNIYDSIWQFPVVLLPLNINNQEGETIVLRPINSQEAMTANFTKLSEQDIYELKNKLNYFSGVNAILYDITNKPPGTIEWE